MEGEQPDNGTEPEPRNDDRRGYVFLSYKREESKQAERLRNALKECGFSVWWDEKNADGSGTMYWTTPLSKLVVSWSCGPLYQCILAGSCTKLRVRWSAVFMLR